jgi:hypothetical protein
LAIDECKDIREHPVTAFILDDTYMCKTGSTKENISWCRDHVANKSTLGFKCLVLGRFNAKTLLPLYFSLHNEGSHVKR